MRTGLQECTGLKRNFVLKTQSIEEKPSIEGCKHDGDIDYGKVMSYRISEIVNVGNVEAFFMEGQRRHGYNFINRKRASSPKSLHQGNHPEIRGLAQL